MREFSLKMRWGLSIILPAAALWIFNCVASEVWVNRFFEIRGGGPVELTSVEYTELLHRAGGAFSYDDGATDVASQKEHLFEKLGIVLTFDRDEAPKSAFFKWYPVTLRHHPVSGELLAEKLSLRTLDRDAFCVEVTVLGEVGGGGTELFLRQSYQGIEQSDRLLVRGHTLLRKWSPLDWILPIQPISVEQDFDQIVGDYPATLKALYEANRWQNESGRDIALPSQEQAANISRVLEGFLIQVFSDQKNVGSQADRELHSLQQVTLWSRIVNGSNQFGWIQFVIGIVLVRGLIASWYCKTNEQEELVAKLAIASLPALGFLGTLLGMALAFARGLEDRNNLTQSLTLAISTSAIALLGALIILWIRGKAD